MKHFPHPSYFIRALLSGVKTIELRPHKAAMYLPGETYYIGEDYMTAPSTKELGHGTIYHVNGEYALIRRPSGHVYAIEAERVLQQLTQSGITHKANSMPMEVSRLTVKIEHPNGRPEVSDGTTFQEEWIWQIGIPFIEGDGKKYYRSPFTGMPGTPREILHTVLERYYGLEGGNKLMMRYPHRVYYYTVKEREFPHITTERK